LPFVPGSDVGFRDLKDMNLVHKDLCPVEGFESTARPRTSAQRADWNKYKLAEIEEQYFSNYNFSNHSHQLFTISEFQRSYHWKLLVLEHKELR
jgi:hypothetical protein